MLVGRKPTKISKSMRKACMSSVTIGRLNSTAQVAKLVNEKIECNVSIQTMRRILKIGGFGVQEKTKKPLLLSKNICVSLNLLKSTRIEQLRIGSM